MPSQYLYVIAEDATSSGPVKLGISNNPDRRLKQLQTAHPGVLSVHYRVAVDAQKAKPLERLLHRDMSHRRMRGEWFDMTIQEAIRQVMFTLMRYEDDLP